MKELTIVIPVWNNWKYTARCLASVFKSNLPKEKYQIIVVDNASTDTTETLLTYLQDRGEPISIIKNETNRGFLLGANDGWKKTTTQYVMQLSNDVTLGTNCISNMLKAFNFDEKVGLVGAVHKISEDSVLLPKHTYLRGKYYTKWEQENKRGVDAVVLSYPEIGDSKIIETDVAETACAIIKKEVWEKIGYFDEIFAPCHYEQEDYSLRAKEAGFKIVIALDAEYNHVVAGTTKIDLNYFKDVCDRNKIIFYERWGEKLRNNLV